MVCQKSAIQNCSYHRLLWTPAHHTSRTFNQLRTEVNFCRLHWEMKGHWSRVNFVKCEAILNDLHATSVLSFSNANEQKCTSILIFMLKRRKPHKSRKNQCQFSVTRPVSFIGKYLPQFSYASLQAKAMGLLNLML